MAAGSEQLSDVLRQINEHFDSHDIISVLPTRGDPPDQYEVTYTIPGMIQVDGEKTLATSHVIELSLPFGFPHFPPSCKPASNPFHPDFDQAAINLGDFWEQNPSLPELIIHIGRMISGEFYSTDNSFNEEAEKWFCEHQDDLPFSTALADSAALEEPSSEQTEIDIPNDPALSSDVEYLFTDDSELDEDTYPVDSEIDIFSLQLLYKQKKHFELVDTIRSLSSSSEQIDQLLFDAQNEIDKATVYYKTAQEKEQKGNADLALAGYKKVADSTSDFPEISSTVDRAERSLNMLKEVISEVLPQSEDKLDTLDLSSGGNHHVEHITSKSAALPAVPEPDPVEQKRGWKKWVKIFILLSILLHVAGIGTYFYIKSLDSKTSSAEQAYRQCLIELDKEYFKAAKDNCEVALQLSKNVSFAQQQTTEGLASKIQTTLQSEKLTQGLAGKTLIAGQYLLPAEIKTLLHFQKLSVEGNDLLTLSLWNEATEKLKEAITVAENNAFIDRIVIPDLTSQLNYVKLQTYIQAAATQLKEESWKEAITSNTVALTYLKTLPVDIQQQYEKQLLQNLGKSQFEDLKQKADKLFSDSDWQKSISAYRRVLLLGKNNESISQETVTEISTNIERARLYQAIINGNLSFNSGSWDEAISAYKSAQSLLADKKELLTPTGSDVNFRKLAKIILRTSSIKNRETAEKQLEENNLPAAKISHEKIVQDIEVSPFNNDSDFLKIKKESSEIIINLSRDIFLNEKRLYLETNYRTLFSLHFPSTSPDNLTQPVITFIEESPETLLFKLQCRESGGGRPLSLVIYYAYDKKAGTWKFSSGVL